jgi:hypothetical protein
MYDVCPFGQELTTIIIKAVAVKKGSPADVAQSTSDGCKKDAGKKGGKKDARNKKEDEEMELDIFG